MSTNSSDGRVQVDVHAAYASALIYVDLTGAGSPSSITIYRNGVALVTQDNTAGTAAWYDHFPPYGSVAYTATANAGAITTTAATVTITAPTDGRTWLKSTDPNLSLRVRLSALGDVEYPKEVGVFRGPNATSPVVLESPLSGRVFDLSVTLFSEADRDGFLALHNTGRPVYYCPPALLHDPAGWVSLGSPRWSRSSARSRAGVYQVTSRATEVSAPTLDPDAVIIPGWGWADIATTYATWDAVAAAKATWIALLRQGVGA